MMMPSQASSAAAAAAAVASQPVALVRLYAFAAVMYLNSAVVSSFITLPESGAIISSFDRLLGRTFFLKYSFLNRAGFWHGLIFFTLRSCFPLTLYT